MGGTFTHRLGLFNSTAPASYSGALVHHSVDQSTGVTSLILSHDTEVYDTGGWHSTSSNNSRLTVPSSVSVVRVITNNLTTTTGGGGYHLKNGATFRGMGGKTTETAGNDGVNLSSALLEVSIGDYFEFEAVAAPSVDSAAGVSSWFAIEKVDSSLKRALVNRSSNQSISAATTTTINWNAEVYDTDSWHDTGSNTSRLTVPSGVSLVRVGGNLTAANTGQSALSFFKNGAGARGLPTYDCEVNGTERLNAWSAPLEVSAGDYFEMRVFATDAINVGSSNENWFAIEEVPSTYKRALVYKTGNQSVNDSTTAVLTFDAEVYDTDSIHDNATNNTRLTVPSGVTQARVGFSIKTPSATGQAVASVRKNGTGSGDYGYPTAETDTAGTDNICGMGAWVDVTAGDYFELRFLQNSGAAMNIGTDNETWFCMECR